MSLWERHPGYPVNESSGIVQELRETNKILRELVRLLQHKMQDNVAGGTMTRLGDTMQPIAPGSTPVFQVTPTFSGAPFALVAAQASVTSSDTVNFPVQLVATDATGTTFEAAIPSTATPPADGETITVTWTYTNTDGTTATVTGTVTEVGIVDDVTGGTFAQIS